MKQRLNFQKESGNLTTRLLELSNQSRKESLSATLIDLVNIRASQLNGCTNCLDMHVKEAKIHGERELRLYHVAAWHDSTLFTAQERAALEWTEAVTKISEIGISDELFDRMRSHFSEKELSDLTFTVSIINTWNRLAVAFKVVHGSSDEYLGLNKAGLK